MSQPLEPDERKLAEHLRAYGDALVEGRAPLPRNDLEVTMYEVQQTRAFHHVPVSPIPSHVKTAIWEDLMNEALVSGTVSSPIPLSGEPQVRTAPRFGKSSKSSTWSDTASFAAVLLLLVSLMSVVAIYNFRPGAPNDTSLPGLASQTLYDPEDTNSFPMVPDECRSNGEVISDAELAQRSLGDWSAPQYGPAKAVPYTRGEEILDTFMSYLRCQTDHFNKVYPPESTLTGTPFPIFSPSAEMQSYYSDRYRYTLLSPDLSPAQQDTIDAYQCEQPQSKVLQSFPLPVNQPGDYAIQSLHASTGEIDELASIFSPSDVYQLPDGRYGAIVGRTSFLALTGQSVANGSGSDTMSFVAFVEEDGRYVIDEMFLLFGSVLGADPAVQPLTRGEC
jgi:hypothetical protein